MDKIFEELKRMGKNNARQLNNVSAQIATASDKHEKTSMISETRKCEEESVQGYFDLQQQIKDLKQKLSAKEATAEAEIKSLEKKLAVAQSVRKDPMGLLAAATYRKESSTWKKI